MAHPFFEAIKYPWHRPEALRLYRALCQHAILRQPSTIVLLYEESCAGLPALAILGTRPADIWKEALDSLTSVGALRKLCELIPGVQGGNSESIQAAIQEVRNAQPAVDTRIISDDILVLDRVRLREQLKLLESEETLVKVLVIRGDPKSGKSHGRFLFERAARDKGALPIYLCDGIVVTVDDVIAQLFAALEASEKIPARLTSEDAWYRTVCCKLQELASNKCRPLWIAVDDLGVGQDGGPLLDTQIRKFCDQFALNMMNPAFRQWFRLMLIHYPEGPVPTKWQREFWREDRTSCADIQQEHVEELLRSWLVAHNRSMLEDQLIGLAKSTIERSEAFQLSGANRMPRLQFIHDAITDTLGNLAKASS